MLLRMLIPVLFALGCGPGAALSILRDSETSTLVISSASQRFSVRLPYSEDWIIETSGEAPLFAESPRLRLHALLSEDHAGAGNFEERTALLLHLYLSSRAFAAKADPGAIKKEAGVLVLEATFKAKEEIYVAATARQASWQKGPEHRTLSLTLKSPQAGPLTPSQVKEFVLQDFRRPAEK
jgi:hypothetical protein